MKTKSLPKKSSKTLDIPRPLEGNYCYASHSGAGTQYPTFWMATDKGTKFYCFNTYGSIHNQTEWDNKTYGSFGMSGRTSNQKLFIEAVKKLNMEGISATIHVTLVSECLKLGAEFIGETRCPRSRFEVDGNKIVDKYTNQNLFMFDPQNKKVAEKIVILMNCTNDYALGIK